MTKQRRDRGGDGKIQAPLNAYNIFFKVQRMRILQGNKAPRGPISEMEIRSVMDDHHKTQGKRRPHRKSHGKIGFRDLARLTAEAWKKVDPESLRLVQWEGEMEKARYHRELFLQKENSAIASEKDKSNQKTQSPKLHCTGMNRFNRCVVQHQATSMNVNAQGRQGNEKSRHLESEKFLSGEMVSPVMPLRPEWPRERSFAETTTKKTTTHTTREQDDAVHAIPFEQHNDDITEFAKELEEWYSKEREIPMLENTCERNHDNNQLDVDFSVTTTAAAVAHYHPNLGDWLATLQQMNKNGNGFALSSLMDPIPSSMLDQLFP